MEGGRKSTMTGSDTSSSFVSDELLSSIGSTTASTTIGTSTMSHHVREGDHINVHVTGHGATIALGLMFLKTENRAIAQLFDPPQTLTLLDRIRPDFLLIR